MASIAKLGRKPKGQGHLRREEILAAARRLLLEEGQQAMTIRRIADIVGVSSTTLYLYFPDRDAILIALCDDAFSSLLSVFKSINMQAAEPLTALKALMRAYVDFGLTHPDAYRLIFMVKALGIHGALHPLEMPEDGPGAQGALCFRTLHAQVKRLVDAGATEDQDAVLLSQMIWMTGHGLVSLLITLREFPWSDRETLVTQMIDLPLNGILKQRR